MGKYLALYNEAGEVHCYEDAERPVVKSIGDVVSFKAVEAATVVGCFTCRNPNPFFGAAINYYPFAQPIKVVPNDTLKVSLSNLRSL